MDTEILVIPFGFSERERLSLSVEIPKHHDWLVTHADIQAGRFTGSAQLYIEAQDIFQWAEALEGLYATLAGKVELRTTEEQIYLELSGDGKGHIVMKGYLMDDLGIGNKLAFTIEYDQTLLLPTLEALRTCKAILGGR